MGAGASMESNDEKLVDLPSLGEDDDVPMLDLKTPAGEVDVDDPLLVLNNRDISKMRKRACAIDSKLDHNPRRKAPPIQPKTCMDGSVAMGKDGDPYVIHKGRWVKATRRVAVAQKELIKERLRKALAVQGSPNTKTKRGRPKGRQPSPPVRKGPSPSKGGKGGMRKPGRQKSPPARTKNPKTPKRKRGRPRGSGKKK